MDDELSLHQHKPKTIHLQNTSAKNEWTVVRRDVTQLFEQFKSSFSKHEKLIEFLSEANPDDILKAKMFEIEKLQVEINNYYLRHVDAAFAAEDTI